MNLYRWQISLSAQPLYCLRMNLKTVTGFNNIKIIIQQCHNFVKYCFIKVILTLMVTFVKPAINSEFVTKKVSVKVKKRQNPVDCVRTYVLP